MLNRVEVTQEILAMPINPGDPCGCFLHEAILQSDESLGKDNVHIDLDRIYVMGYTFKLSKAISLWQENAIGYYDEDGWSEHEDCTEPEPIVLVADGNRLIIEGESNE